MKPRGRLDHRSRRLASLLVALVLVSAVAHWYLWWRLDADSRAAGTRQRPRLIVVLDGGDSGVPSTARVPRWAREILRQRSREAWPPDDGRESPTKGSARPSSSPRRAPDN